MGVRVGKMSPVFLCASLVLPGPLVADQASDANRRIVEAVQTWSEAEELSGHDGMAVERLQLLLEVQQDLEQIIRDYPETDSAVALAVGESLGPLSLLGVESATEEISSAVAAEGTSAEACFLAPTFDCLIE